jgi:hypothetical protein
MSPEYDFMTPKLDKYAVMEDGPFGQHKQSIDS